MLYSTFGLGDAVCPFCAALSKSLKVRGATKCQKGVKQWINQDNPCVSAT